MASVNWISARALLELVEVGRRRRKDVAPDHRQVRGRVLLGFFDHALGADDGAHILGHVKHAIGFGLVQRHFHGGDHAVAGVLIGLDHLLQAGGSPMMTSSVRMTAKGSSPTRRRAHPTAWPRPSACVAGYRRWRPSMLVLRRISSRSVLLAFSGSTKLVGVVEIVPQARALAARGDKDELLDAGGIGLSRLMRTGSTACPPRS